MTIAELMEKDRSAFRGFDKWMRFRFIEALNEETPVEKLKEKPYFLDLSDTEKAVYELELADLKEERKARPWAAYEARYKDID